MFGVFAAFGLFYCNAVAAQVSDSALLDKQIEINLTDTSVTEVLSFLAVHENIPVGLERAYDYRDRLMQSMVVIDGRINWIPSAISIRSGTVRAILDSLVAQDTSYKWDVFDGVVNVFPAVNRDDFLAQFLDARVERFSWTKDVDRFEVRNKLVRMPEIAAFLNKHGVTSLDRVYDTGVATFIENRTFEVKSGNIRTTLNRIVTECPFKMWTLERIGDEKETLLLSF
jgi:hypothetical protein